MTPERYAKIRAVLERRQPDLTVVADQIHIGRNLAAIRRSCDAMGVPEMHAVVPPGFKQKRFAGTTMGTHKWVRLHKHSSFESCLSVIKSQGMQVASADVSTDAVDFRRVDFTKPTAIILGAEVDGLTEEGRNAADVNFTIPMLGMVESFNVSVAFALVLAEAIRQREAAGMIGQPAYSEAEIERIAFEWGYPKLHRYYAWKGLPYPKLDEQGQLVDA